MKDLKRFATEDFPLHPSGLRTLIDCPWRLVMMYLYAPTDESGPAADTGSAVHTAAHALHDGKEVAECLSVMKEKLADRIESPRFSLFYMLRDAAMQPPSLGIRQRLVSHLPCQYV